MLIGPNNSGKTSLIAPLLLLKQTLRSTDPSNTALITQGSLFGAGWFKSLIHQHQRRRDLTLGLRFRSRPSAEGPERPLGVYPPGGCDLVFAPSEDPNVTVLREYRVFDIIGRLLLRRRRRDTGRYTLHTPSELERRAPARRPDATADRLIRRAIESAYPEHFLFSAAGIVSVAVDTGNTVGTPQGSWRLRKLDIPFFAARYMSAVEIVSKRTRDLLTNISYVGPLREPPRRLYQITGYMPPDVGTRGQFAPEIIHRQPSAQVSGLIREWLRRFGLPSDIRCPTLGTGAFSLEFRRNTKSPWVSLADLGFGLSQILPLIVQGFYGARDSYLVAEQPEIHLNPKLQAQLADLFVAVARSGRGALIETHSEHLVLRLRSLIARGAIKAEDVALYYVEKERDTSSVKRVPIQKNGHIEAREWPTGFFEESLRDSLELAAWQSKSRSDAK